MRSASCLVALALCAGVVAEAQDRTIIRSAPLARAEATLLAGAANVVIGVTTSTSGNARDTLGLLVTSVSSGGPAEQAGIIEGDRLQSINGVSLRLAAADIDDAEMRGLVRRRLTRELAKVQPNEEVTLRVYADGRSRDVRVRVRAREQVMHRPNIDSLRRLVDNRPAIGIRVSTTGSIRDTLGIFVTGVDDGGPAARAGIVEGMRIAEVNGVSLRTSREDIQDGWVSSNRVNRLQREIAKLNVGDEAELKIWQGNQLRTVRVRTVRSADLPNRGSRVIIGDGGEYFFPQIIDEIGPAMRQMEVELRRLEPAMREVEGEVRRLAPVIRESIERAIDGAGRAMEDAGSALRQRETRRTS